MKTILPLLVLGGMILSGCGNDNSGNSSTNTVTNTASAPAANPNNPMNYLGTLAAADKLAVKTVDVASLNKALEQFNVQEGRFPKDLTELVPAYIAHVPDAPFGYKLDYNPTSGEVKVVKADN
jgi:hypothetical protein